MGIEAQTEISRILERYRVDRDSDKASREIWEVLCDRKVTQVPIAYLRWEVATVVLARLVEDQTNHGGIDALFYNGWGGCAEPCANALRDIGARRKASVLRTAMNSYWGGSYPRSCAEWERISDAVPPDEEQIPKERELEEVYFRDSEDIEKLIVEFVSENAAAF